MPHDVQILSAAASGCVEDLTLEETWDLMRRITIDRQHIVGRNTESLREAESIFQHLMLEGVVKDLAKLFAAVERLSTQQTQPQQLSMIIASCSFYNSRMHLTTNCPSRFQEESTLFQQRPGQSQSLVPDSYSYSKCGGNNSQCNFGFQGANSSLQVHSPSSQDDSLTMITPYEQDFSPNKNDVKILLKGMVDLEASMKNQMATMENRIVDFAKQCVQTGPGDGLEAGRNSVSCEHVGPVPKLDQHESDPVPGKVDVQLKKPPDNWAKKKFIKAGDKRLPYLNAPISGHDCIVLIGLMIC
ncbi:Transposon Ty3-G Gag-Pol polyprotein [Senna tora]|uniref:Transposon Ty3-G Gag-Pol polyprotein n=1 Tax=Senna tora TaxID=362788 RepID=A0A834WVG8_9FABA|nr:Transposon Ty3-G Gag-Pol polyprotein [Senna tora]